MKVWALCAAIFGGVTLLTGTPVYHQHTMPATDQWRIIVGLAMLTLATALYIAGAWLDGDE